MTHPPNPLELPNTAQPWRPSPAQLPCSTAIKNITLKIDDETYHTARVRAAEKGTSLSAMAREFLLSLERDSNDRTRSESDRVKRLLKLYEEADAEGPKQKATSWTSTVMDVMKSGIVDTNILRSPTGTP